MGSNVFYKHEKKKKKTSLGNAKKKIQISNKLPIIVFVSMYIHIQYRRDPLL